MGMCKYKWILNTNIGKNVYIENVSNVIMGHQQTYCYHTSKTLIKTLNLIHLNLGGESIPDDPLEDLNGVNNSAGSLYSRCEN